MMRVRKFKTLSLLLATAFSIIYIVCHTISLPFGSKDGTVEKLGTIQFQNITDCLCSRRWKYPPNMTANDKAQISSRTYLKRLNSTCSDEGTHFQTNQNVITYSLFNSQNSSTNFTSGSFQTSPLNYQMGLLRNLFRMRQHYPGYSLRVYTTVTLSPGGYFCDLLCQNEDLFWCDIRKTPSHGDLTKMNFRTWRFLPMGDPTVKIFHPRDLDSLIGDREAAAVSDWLFKSEKDYKAIMAMRDHPFHSVPMLAGMWGADNSKLLEKGEKLRNKLILESQLSTSRGKHFDQTFLAKFVFYPLAQDILAYDSYHCVKWSNFTEVRAFPVQQKNPATECVGNIINFFEDGKPRVWKKVECPLKCRPSYGLDWKYC